MVGAGTDKTKRPLTGGPSIILVHPQLAVNIGMCARAMANFGLSDLRIVTERSLEDFQTQLQTYATPAAAGAVHLLEQAQIYGSVREAIADLHFIFATTARERGQNKPVLSPRQAMQEMNQTREETQTFGVLFGPERTGLHNDEISLAQSIITFPVDSAYGSLNLAQAVLLIAYEWFLASQNESTPFSQPQRSGPAPRHMILSFFEYIETELNKAGFFRPIDKKEVMVRNLRNIFHRMQLTEQDVRTLRGALTRLVEGPRAMVKEKKISLEKKEK